MSDENKPMTKHELEALIVGRCWKDDSFRQEFMADPKAIFERYTEQELPPDVTIVAHSETATEVHFVIPEKPKAASGVELSDDDLDKVAGGEFLVSGIVVASATTATVASAGALALSGLVTADVTVTLATAVAATKDQGW